MTVVYGQWTDTAPVTTPTPSLFHHNLLLIPSHLETTPDLPLTCPKIYGTSP